MQAEKSTEPSMPTIDAILDRIALRKDKDAFGFEVNEYIGALPFAQAKAFLKPETTEATWGKPDYTSRADVIVKMKDYMPFAWEKANDCRGLSANRSVEHYIAWTWLAGDTALSDTINREYMQSYQHYGKEILKRICDHYGWDSKQWDDGHWVND